MSKSDGGSAFPVARSCHDRRDEGGMTLRDYFAGQAVASGGFTERKPASNKPEEIARDAYLIADAMLAERAK